LNKKIKRKIVLFIVPFLAFLLTKIILLLSKKKFTAQSLPDEPYIVSIWHGELLLQSYFYIQKNNNRTIHVIASDHNDGILISKFVSYFGINIIQGSSTRGGVKALIKAIKQMRSGGNVAITPDGPRGPKHSVADGIVHIAQKLDCYIVPHRIEIDKKWTLNSWDNFIIPKPFSQINFLLGEAFKITELTTEEAKISIKKAMENVKI